MIFVSVLAVAIAIVSIMHCASAPATGKNCCNSLPAKLANMIGEVTLAICQNRHIPMPLSHFIVFGTL